MKRFLLIFVTLLIVLCGCSSNVLQSNENASSIGGKGGNDGIYEGDEFRYQVIGTFIDYVGGRDFDAFVKEVENAKEPSGYGLFVHFCIRFDLTRNEILTVMYWENERLEKDGSKPYYPERGMKDVMKILFGDENIELKEPVDVFTKASSQFGLIFGDTEIADAKGIENPLYYSIPQGLQIYVGVRQINQWAAGLEKREDYNIVNFVRYFDVPADVFDNAIQVLNYNAHVQNAADRTPILLDQKIYDLVRLELYGETKPLSEVSLPEFVYQQSSEESSLPWNTPEEKASYYAASEALMAQSQTSSEVSSTVTSR